MRPPETAHWDSSTRAHFRKTDSAAVPKSRMLYTSDSVFDPVAGHFRCRQEQTAAPHEACRQAFPSFLMTPIAGSFFRRYVLNVAIRSIPALTRNRLRHPILYETRAFHPFQLGRSPFEKDFTSPIASETRWRWDRPTARPSDTISLPRPHLWRPRDHSRT